MAKCADEKVTGYRVRYTEWSSRFDEWVDPKRVVEPSDNNILVQVSRPIHYHQKPFPFFLMVHCTDKLFFNL